MARGCLTCASRSGDECLVAGRPVSTAIEGGARCVAWTPASTQEATKAANAKGEGFKADAGKPDFSLLPWEPVEDIVSVLTLGAKKYAPDNWQKVPDAERRYLAAALRHIWARARGERLDPETGRPHLAHAGCCLLFLAWFDKRSAA